MQTSPSSHFAVVLVLTHPFTGSQVSSVHGLPSSQLCVLPATHLPAAQASPTVQALLSLHFAVFGSLLQPPLALQISVVQGLLSSQGAGFPAVQAPPLQTSPVVQTLPSSQGAVLFAFTHPVVPPAPVALQLSVVQGLPSSQLFGWPPPHLPAVQISPVVQRLPSSHAPLFAVCTQPAVLLQLSVVQAFLSSQSVTPAPAQPPLAQVSPVLQGLPSSHAPLLGVCTQPALASHVSVVQGLPSSHFSAAPPLQTPPLHASFSVQPLPSLQDAMLLVAVQPLLGSQASSVQILPSSQATLAPPIQAPPAHTSFVVQASPSLQTAVFATTLQPAFASQLSVVHGLPSSHVTAAPPLHAPPAHTSFVVQTSPSLQGRSFAALLQPPAASQVSVVQGFLSSQGAGFPAVQTPALQRSSVVQALPSSQGAVLLVLLQPPLGSHASVVQGLASSHGTALPPPQLPAAQVSPAVQALPSSQGLLVPTLVQPVFGSQASAVQGLPSSHCGAAPPAQAPDLQASFSVQALPSLQGKVFAALVQPPLASQVSVVQGLPSSQGAGLPATQMPSLQASTVVHTLPSSHVEELFFVTQPVLASQLSSVHGFASSQVTVAPPLQVPPLHKSFVVHASPSSQLPSVAADLQPVFGSQLSVVHGLPSSQFTAAPPTHAPFAQASLPVHALPSEHPPVAGAVAQPVVGLQLSIVQGLPSSHDTAVPAHLPPAQVSLVVQVLPSSHAAVFCAVTQPVFGSQLSVVQGSPSSHALAPAPLQLPASHASGLVQGSPSSHGAVLFALLQPPPLSHVSVVQGLLSSHGAGLVALHTPPVHVSPVVQALPSSHAAELAACWQPVFGSQLSSVHGLLSSQAFCVAPATHVPPAQLSPSVQRLSSLQSLPPGTPTQPKPALQVSSVQGLPSSQATGVPPPQTPAAQAPPTLHLLPSSHFTPSGAAKVWHLLETQAAIAHTTSVLQSAALVQVVVAGQFGIAAWLQAPVAASQASSVHTSLSSQSAAL